jgi:DNA-binding GntR family transcriptional regulator
VDQNGVQSVLLKQSAAARLRDEILSGRLGAGQRIVEGKWAAELGVAQGSIREALNLLALDGLVIKGAGRSARVVSLTGEDVRQTYDVRVGLESQAARLVTETRADLSDMRRILAAMEEAARADDITTVINEDLTFHLTLAKKTGNRLLFEHTERLLTPLFAFVLLRARSSGAGLQPWTPTLPSHGRILDVIEFGDPDVAEEYVARITREFASNAQMYWTDTAKRP